MTPPVVAIFGPTGVGKTGVAVALAELLAERGHTAIAVNCDSMQIYGGLEVISGAPSQDERAALEHRLLGMIPISEQYSAGRFADAAHREIDGLLAAGSWPLVVGGTGLYLRAALSQLELRPPIPEAIQQQVKIELERDGAERLHRELPDRFRTWVAPGDRKRIARLTGLLRAGIEPAENTDRGGELWTKSLRHPSILFGLTLEDSVLTERIDSRVEAMAAAGAGHEADRADRAGASRTARAAIGFEEFRSGDLERVKLLHRRYGRRQLTWMRRMEGVTQIDRTDLNELQTAELILTLIDDAKAAHPA